MSKAPRLPGRALQGVLRGATLTLGVWLAGMASAQSCLESAMAKAMPGSTTITRGAFGAGAAWYEQPTAIYGHAIMGNVQDADRLHAVIYTSPDCTEYSVEAGPDHVFEDIAPHLVDVDRDGVPEIVAVRSSVTQGAQLAVYQLSRGAMTLLASTPYIGTRFRWLAPIGAADLDGDGAVELAYIDRPHLAKTLRIWRYRDGALTQIAAGGGLTNHRIGEEYISGGLRDCSGDPEMILATANWAQIVAVTLEDGDLQARNVGAPTDRAGFDAAMDC